MKKIFIFTGAAIVAVFILVNLPNLIGFLRGVSPAILPLSEKVEDLEEGSGLPFSFPLGFQVSIFASGLVAPRVMAFDPYGNILTSVTSEGKVIALADRDGDFRADQNKIILSGLDRPHGLAFHCEESCKLFVAESGGVYSYDYDPLPRASGREKLFDLPAGGRHFTRTILFRAYPDEDELLISVGSSCDVCLEEDPRRAKILSYNLKTKELKDFARGLRNSVFMALHPVSGEIWATEMGRDFLGDDLPPDEINIIKEGGNYGWPICYGKNIHDRVFDKNTYIRNPCLDPLEIPSHIDIPAHSAPLGLAFFPEEGWPEEYWYDLLVAYHGSWNRSIPTGYKIERLKLDAEGNFLGSEEFMAGFLKEGAALGRPADILILPGGIIYVSDDKAGVIYRIIYRQ